MTDESKPINVYSKPCICCQSDKHATRQCPHLKYIQFDSLGNLISYEEFAKPKTEGKQDE